MTELYKAMRRVYTIQEIAFRFGLKRDTLERALWQGRLAGVRKGNLWLVCDEDVEQAIKDGKLRSPGEKESP